jgi:hypothetical protein
MPDYQKMITSFACNISLMNSDISKRFAQQYAQFMGLSFDKEGLEKLLRCVQAFLH